MLYNRRQPSSPSAHNFILQLAAIKMTTEIPWMFLPGDESVPSLGATGDKSRMAMLVDSVMMLNDNITTLSHKLYWDFNKIAWKVTYANLFEEITRICALLEVPLSLIVKAKMLKNRKQYPQEEAAVSSPSGRVMPKYTELDCKRSADGHSKTGTSRGRLLSDKSIQDNKADDMGVMLFYFIQDYCGIRDDVYNFAQERGWVRSYNNPMLAVSLRAEAGELCGAVEWQAISGNDQGVLQPYLIDKIASEVADVTIYLLHVARVNNVDVINILNHMHSQRGGLFARLSRDLLYVGRSKRVHISSAMDVTITFKEELLDEQEEEDRLSQYLPCPRHFSGSSPTHSYGTAPTATK